MSTPTLERNDPLRTKCYCGKYGRGLSTCRHCGEFITMTLIVVKKQKKKRKCGPAIDRAKA